MADLSGLKAAIESVVIPTMAMQLPGCREAYRLALGREKAIYRARLLKPEATDAEIAQVVREEDTEQRESTRSFSLETFERNLILRLTGC